MPQYTTEFGSLASYKKGGVLPITEDPKRFVFSNIFEVASKSKPWDRVVVGKKDPQFLHGRSLLSTCRMILKL